MNIDRFMTQSGDAIDVSMIWTQNVGVISIEHMDARLSLDEVIKLRDTLNTLVKEMHERQSN